MIKDAGVRPGIPHPTDFFLEECEERNDEEDDDKDKGKGV